MDVELRASQGARERSLFLFLRLVLMFSSCSSSNPTSLQPSTLQSEVPKGFAGGEKTLFLLNVSCCGLCRELGPAGSVSSDSPELLPALPNHPISCSVLVCSLEGQRLLHGQHQLRNPQGPIQPVQLQLEPLWGDAAQVQASLHPGHMLV